MSKKRKLAGASIFAHLPPELRSSIRAQKLAHVEAPSRAATIDVTEGREEVDVQRENGEVMPLSKRDERAHCGVLITYQPRATPSCKHRIKTRNTHGIALD